MTVLEAGQTQGAEDPWATVPVIGAGVATKVPEGFWPPPAQSWADDLSVHCTTAGDPRVLVHRGREHRVVQPVLRWYERRNWWETEERVPRESTTSAVDRECWRVQAVQPGAAVTRTFDLTRDQFTGRWRVLGVSC